MPEPYGITRPQAEVEFRKATWPATRQSTPARDFSLSIWRSNYYPAVLSMPCITCSTTNSTFPLFDVRNHNDQNGDPAFEGGGGNSLPTRQSLTSSFCLTFGGNAAYLPLRFRISSRTHTSHPKPLVGSFVDRRGANVQSVKHKRDVSLMQIT